MALDTSKMSPLFAGLSLQRGPEWKNRFALAPLTNTQSHPDGTLSEDELNWLSMRAAGGFGLTMTCAIAVQSNGRGYPGQLGAWDDTHIDGLTRLAQSIKSQGSVACAQLAHSGPRALEGLERVGVMPNAENGVSALSDVDIEDLIEGFVDAAKRADVAGFDGVEIHAAHGFLPAQFLSPELNQRDDNWGGGLENRARLILDILRRIRSELRPDFQLGLRLSPERFGLRMVEVLELAQTIMLSGEIDWLDMSLWDVMKAPEEPEFSYRPLVSWFAELDRGTARLGVAGNIMGAAEAAQALEMGADFVLIGKGAILAHDFPRKIAADADYQSPPRPVSEEVLREQGLGTAFIDYMRSFGGFVE